MPNAHFLRIVVSDLIRGRSVRYISAFDQDLGRLEKTARKLGVRKVVVTAADMAYQHVDLCGKPLDKAEAMAGVDA